MVVVVAVVVMVVAAGAVGGLRAWVYSSSPGVAGGEAVHGLDLLAQGANAQGEQEGPLVVPLLRSERGGESLVSKDLWVVSIRSRTRG